MHAVLITAYKDYPSLARLVRRLDRDFFRIYIHLDRRGGIGRAQREELERLGARTLSRHRIRWGSIAHLDAIMDLLREAVRAGGVDYLHLISGQDYPLAGPEEFERRCDGRIFTNFEALAEAPHYVRERYELRNHFYFLQTGSRVANRIYRYLNDLSLWLQKGLGLRRTSVDPYRSLYKGIVWSSFPFAVAGQLLEDPIAVQFRRALRTAYIPEEVFLQTYFLNSDLRSSVVNDDLRYTDWRRRNGSVPAFLDETDLEAVLQSNALFARKVHSELSAELLDHIDSVRFTPSKSRA